MVCFLWLCYREHRVTIRMEVIRWTLKLKNIQYKEQLLCIAKQRGRDVCALKGRNTQVVQMLWERNQHQNAYKLNKSYMALGPVAEATRTPDEIMLAVMQSFSSQLSGFFSLLLLKRCFEIWLPFEVSRVQHDIYLRYKPNPFAFQIPSSLPPQNHRSPFPASLIHFPPRESGTKAMPRPGCPPLPPQAGGASSPRRAPSPCPSASGGALLKAGEGEEECPLRRRQSAD